MTIMVFGAAAIDCSGSSIEEGEQITDAVTLILEVLQNRLIAPGRQVWRKTLECLDAGTLIKTVQVFRRVQVTVNDMQHFGEKVWIGDLQLVFMAVRSQCVF